MWGRRESRRSGWSLSIRLLNIGDLSRGFGLVSWRNLYLWWCDGTCNRGVLILWWTGHQMSYGGDIPHMVVNGRNQELVRLSLR